MFQSGHDVLLIARGAHLEAIQRDGLRFITPNQDCRLEIPAVGHPRDADIGGDDIIVLCVKSQHTDEALQELYDVAGDDVPVVCAQNGVSNEFVALRRFRRVYGMVVYLPAEHLQPGEVINSAEESAGMLDVGCYPSGIDSTVEELATALTASGFSSLPDPAIMRLKYSKLLANLGNALQAACDESSREVMRTLREEALSCYEKADIDCATAEETRQRLEGVRTDSVAGRERSGGSSWQSIQRGTGNIETDHLNGEIVQMGRRHGVATPGNVVIQRLGNRLAAERLPVGSFTLEDVMRMIEVEPH